MLKKTFTILLDVCYPCL